MRNLPALTKRETRTFFLSPFAYFVAAIYLILFGFFFSAYYRSTFRLDLGDIVVFQMGFLSMFFIPLLTMRMFSEERASGTLETLMTAPVSDLEVVVSKYLSAIAFVAFMILPTLAYYVLVRIGGKPDWGPVVTQYIGLLLLCSLYCAVGLFMSSLTKDQVLAAMLSLVALLFLLILEPLADMATDGDRTSNWFLVARYVNYLRHAEGFSKGILDLTDVVFFLSFIVYFLFLSIRSVETRKWS